MLILIDKKAPAEAKRRLAKEGEVVEFETSGICYDAISGHPDIFFYQHPGGLVIAPNTPAKYKEILLSNKISFMEGLSPVGQQYPETAPYNALYTAEGIIHNSKFTDPVVMSTHMKTIHCNQGYVRCNTIHIGNIFFTSDRGIEKSLKNSNKNVKYVNSQHVVLKGFDYGFLGGCAGVKRKKLYFCGSFDSLPDNETLSNTVYGEGFEIVELYGGPLIDVGGIFFLER